MTGVTPAIPGLLGLPKDWLQARLGAWRFRKRRAASPRCMAAIGRRLAPQDVTAVASYLALQPVSVAAKPAPTLPLPLTMQCDGIPRLRPASGAGQWLPPQLSSRWLRPSWWG